MSEMNNKPNKAGKNKIDKMAPSANVARKLSPSKKKKLLLQLQSLNDEMDICTHAVMDNGQYKRKISRSESGRRTIKRKLLEKHDIAPTEKDTSDEIQGTDGRIGRLRGSKIALEDHIVEASRIIRKHQEQENNQVCHDVAREMAPLLDNHEIVTVEDLNQNQPDDEDEQEDEQEKIVEDTEMQDKAELADERDASFEPTAEKPLEPNFNQQQQNNPTAPDQQEQQQSQSQQKQSQQKKEYMYRMPRLSTQRLAKAHGRALAAHAQGRFQEAIRILSQVAAEAPSAPQIYSSLGMVYETLKNWEKAYGAYHVAAVLCKKDYTLWVRAGDLATRVVGGGNRWMMDALKDYKAADALKPPGLEVPCKLAATHLELGNLIDCLTILIDLQRKGGDFRYWKLYALCLLKLGHACIQMRSENYMVKRWLKKYGEVFDWRGRRLQALAMAFEHAVGSDIGQNVREWVIRRAIDEDDGSDDDDYRDEKCDNDQTDNEGCEPLKEGQDKGNVEKKRVTKIEMPSTDQPLSASISQVCLVGAELMKHCLGLEAFEGSYLVANAVSKYLKARGIRRARRVAQREAMLNQRSDVHPLFLPTDYDGVDNSSESDDEGFYISDDDDIDDNNEPAFVQSLEQGILPPELQVLYALSLIGMGNKRYLASKFIPAISLLPIEVDDNASPGIDNDPSWQLFSAAMTKTLNRTSAFAFAVDLLRKIGQEKEWADTFAPLLRDHLDSVSIDLTGEAVTSAHQLLKRNHEVKVVLSSIRFDLVVCEKQIQQNEKAANAFNGVELLSKAMDNLLNVAQALWKIGEKQALSPNCCEIVQLAAQASNLAPMVELFARKSGKLETAITLFRKMGSFAKHFFNFEFDIAEKVANEEHGGVSLGELPISSDWQGEKFKKFSVSVYNMAIGSNVALFSGWEEEEFNLSLLRRRGKNNHFGVTMQEGRIVGRLKDPCLSILSKIWATLSKATECCVSFDDLFATAKDAIDVDTSFPDEEVSTFAESSALMFLLNFGYIGTLLLENTSTPNTLECDTNKLLRIILSVTLPATQFCIPRRIWDSGIGIVASSSGLVDEWQTAAKQQVIEKPAQKLPPATPRKYPKKKHVPKLVEKFKNETPYTCLRKMLKVPMDVLQSMWESGAYNQSNIDTEMAKKKQQNLDRCMFFLRKSKTEATVQKASLEVAVALMEIIPYCPNPFIPYLQAPTYCHHAPPGGQNDIRLKVGLPDLCLPSDALQILCRAECLAAINFGMEATFLVSHVVRQCTLNPPFHQWKAIRLCAYNTSLSIQAINNEEWEGEVLVELLKFRKEGLAMLKMENMQDDEEYEDEEVSEQKQQQEKEEEEEEVEMPQRRETTNATVRRAGGPQAQDFEHAMELAEQIVQDTMMMGQGGTEETRADELNFQNDSFANDILEVDVAELVEV